MIRLTLRIDDELYNIAKRIIKDEYMSFNSYVLKLITRDIDERQELKKVNEIK